MSEQKHGKNLFSFSLQKKPYKILSLSWLKETEYNVEP